jgi:hypothetical protein
MVPQRWRVARPNFERPRSFFAPLRAGAAIVAAIAMLDFGTEAAMKLEITYCVA